jgi:hemoglobin
MRIRQIGLVLAVLFAIAACGGKQNPQPTAKLYDRLGGKDAITAVVDEFVNTAAANPAFGERFKNTNAADLKAKLVDQICEVSGGPCKYTGKSMKEAHTGMKITEEEFNALVGDLVKALDKFNVKPADKDELLKALGGMKGDIVGI